MSNIVGTYPAERKPIGYRQLEVGSTAVDLDDATGGIPAGATRAIIWVEVDSIRWRDDGEDPTSSVGMYVDKNLSFELLSAEAIANFKAIQAGTEEDEAVLNIAYYKS
jgi:hypothetical protein